jgi:uncharacterized membrane protein
VPLDSYFVLKLIHVLSATLLFGTGLGTAFFMWMAHRSGNVAAIAVTAGHVVLADFVFTTPAAIAQPITGFLLLQRVGYPLSLPWLALAIALYVVAGLCWLPVVWIQMRVRDLACAAHARGEPLPESYYRHMRLWFVLGWPAFLAVLAVFGLMVFKPA